MADAMRIGDIVRRKQAFEVCGGWTAGSTLCEIVSKTEYGDIIVERTDGTPIFGYWVPSRFELVSVRDPMTALENRLAALEKLVEEKLRALTEIEIRGKISFTERVNTDDL